MRSSCFQKYSPSLDQHQRHGRKQSMKLTVRVETGLQHRARRPGQGPARARGQRRALPAARRPSYLSGAHLPHRLPFQPGEIPKVSNTEPSAACSATPLPSCGKCGKTVTFTVSAKRQSRSSKRNRSQLHQPAPHKSTGLVLGSTQGPVTIVDRVGSAREPSLGVRYQHY